jgi:ferredoxin
MQVKRRVVLHFPQQKVDQPVICYLTRDHNLLFNILRASITPEDVGLMVLELIGTEADYERGIAYLAEQGITLQPLKQDVLRTDERCVNCGACVGICPSEALFLERPSMVVGFDPERCTACEACVMACPTRAMVVRY